MKRVIVLLCASYLILAYGTAFAASPTRATTTLSDIPPAWSKTLQCDTTACPRFELVMGGKAVLDHETGLVWEQSPSTAILNWLFAQVHCNQLTTGGRLGWRLPTIQELASLVDPTQENQSLPAGHPFSNVQSSLYWSATTFSSDTSVAWNVYFYNGTVNYDFKSDSVSVYVWCVRGGHGVDPE